MKPQKLNFTTVSCGFRGASKKFGILKVKILTFLLFISEFWPNLCFGQYNFSITAEIPLCFLCLSWQIWAYFGYSALPECWCLVWQMREVSSSGCLLPSKWKHSKTEIYSQNLRVQMCLHCYSSQFEEIRSDGRYATKVCVSHCSNNSAGVISSYLISLLYLVRGQQFAQQIQQQNPELIEQLRNHIRSRSFSGSAEEQSWSTQVVLYLKLKPSWPFMTL